MIIRRLGLIFFLGIIGTTSLYPQGVGTCNPGDEGCEPDIPITPIDGGVSLLIGAAALYGIKKIRTNRKQDDPE